MLSYTDAEKIFRQLRCVVIDELHALAGTKRGDLLALGLARLAQLAPGAGASACPRPSPIRDHLTAYLSKTGRAGNGDVRTSAGPDGGAAPEVDILTTRERLPWAGRMAVHALGEVYDQIRKAGHDAGLRQYPRPGRDRLSGALEAQRRRPADSAPPRQPRRRAAPQGGSRHDARSAARRGRHRRRWTSASTGPRWTSSIQVGAPKGVSRLLQRIGRANHRLDEASRAVLVPANRFEVLECRAASRRSRHDTLDGDPPRPGGLDVLAQHILGMGCAAPFDADDLYRRDHPRLALCRAHPAGLRRHAELRRDRRLRAAAATTASASCSANEERPLPRRRPSAWRGSTG